MESSSRTLSEPAPEAPRRHWATHGLLPLVVLAGGVILVGAVLGLPVPLLEMTPGSSLGEGLFLVFGALMILVGVHGVVEGVTGGALLFVGIGTIVAFAVSQSSVVDVRFQQGDMLLVGFAIVAWLTGMALIFIQAERKATGARPRRKLIGFIFPLIMLAGGGVFLAEAAGADLRVIDVRLNAGWVRVGFLIVGSLAAFLGGRGLLRVVAGVVPSKEEIARNQDRARARGVVTLLVGAFLVAVLVFDGSLAAVDVERGGWFFWLFAVTCLLLASILLWDPVPTMEKVEKAKKLEAGEGIRGRAVILDFDDTGTTINDNPRVRLRLEVTLGDRAPYEVERAETVSRLSTGRLLKGESLPVVADPENPEELRILWKEK